MNSVRVNSMRGQTLARMFMVLLSLLSFCSCRHDLAKKPSVIIVAIENYGPEKALCNWESHPQVQQKLQAFCDRAIEFKSVHSVEKDTLPALGSFLFGAPAKRLGLENNNSFLKSQFESYAERMENQGYSTSFFGSSPLVMKRSGLGQGFEHFEESLQVEKLRWGRTSKKVVQSFLKWKHEQSTPTYSVLHISDLQFPWIQTINFSGQTRTRGYEGQVEELEESLSELFEKLQNEPDWQQTWVLVVGLQGGSSELHPRQVFTAIKAPIAYQNKIDASQSLDLVSLSYFLHSKLLSVHSDEPTADSTTLEEEKGKLTLQEYWLKPDLISERLREYSQEKISDPNLDWWKLYELLVADKEIEFKSIVKNHKLDIDADAFWERLKTTKKMKSFQDPCLRLIDHRILQGDGSKHCDSVVIKSMQEWNRIEDETNSDSATENKLNEARQKTLKLWQELRAIRQAHLINRALGRPLEMPLSIGAEILRVEMSLRLPSAQTQRIWLEKHADDLAGEIN